MGNGCTNDEAGTSDFIEIPASLVVLSRVNLNTPRQRRKPSDGSSERRVPAKQRITQSLRRKIVTYYESGNVSAQQAAEEHGVGKSTVLKILREAGAEVRPHGRRIT